jgi:glycine/D-amino acid oxidase-like deaminating enzyme/nitrite reductase/ring-hydroxylating ferredoxin subunit
MVTTDNGCVLEELDEVSRGTSLERLEPEALMRMTSDGGSSTSLWAQTAEDVPLATDAEPAPETDIAVIGAGIAGLTTALELVRCGARVMVLDDGPIGGGETGRTSAHLTSAIDDLYHVIERKRGRRVAALVAESHMAAIDKIESNVRELSIDCEFQRVDGYLFAPPGERHERKLEREYEAARRAGLLVDRVERAPLPFDTGPALRFARQAQFHPLKYLRGLARAVVSGGGALVTGAHVDAVEPGAPVTLRLAGGRKVACRVAVDATNGALTSPVKLAIQQAAYRSYVITYELTPGRIPDALYWDTADPYHYLRVARGPDGRELLIVGGSDHRTGQGDPGHAFVELDRWVRRWISIAGAIVARWSGQILEPADSLAYIGKCPGLDHVYLVSGDSGEGLTHGTIAGMLLPELMRGKRSPWAEVYDPARSHLRSLGTLLKEATRSTLAYADWLRGGDVGSSDDVARGEGAVVRRGLHFVACYRDAGGMCHERSATCTHLGGVVSWNAVEKTWDCPCHGSRFDPYGRVLNGPATSDLRPAPGGPEAPAEVGVPVAGHVAPGVPAGAPDPTPAIRAAVIDQRNLKH